MLRGLNAIPAALRKGRFSTASWLLRFYLGRCTDNWYMDLFPDDPELVAGEFTPSYSMLDAQDVERVKRLTPNAKIIFVLRDPIERAWSQVRFSFLRNGHTSLPDDPTLIRFIDSATQVLRGDYLRTYRLWAEQFERENILVTFMDDIASDPTAVVGQLWDFLGVENISLPAHRLQTVVNPTQKADMPPAIRDHLIDRKHRTHARSAETKR